MPEDVIELRIKQLKDWLDSGYMTYEQLLTIQELVMEMKRLICTRNESPDTCFLCEQEGKDYCMICADTYTKTEYQETYKEHTPVKIADIFFGFWW